MTRRLAALAALAGAGAFGVVAGRAFSSRSPEDVGGPLPPCSDEQPNCYRDRRTFTAGPDRVFAAAEAAVRDLRGLTIGRVTSVTPDAAARTLTADVRVGPFEDRLRLAVEAGPASGAVLYVRSRSRLPGADLGVNRRRVRALLEAVSDALGA